LAKDLNRHFWKYIRRENLASWTFWPGRPPNNQTSNQFSLITFTFINLMHTTFTFIIHSCSNFKLFFHCNWYLHSTYIHRILDTQTTFTLSTLTYRLKRLKQNSWRCTFFLQVFQHQLLIDIDQKKLWIWHLFVKSQFHAHFCPSPQRHESTTNLELMQFCNIQTIVELKICCFKPETSINMWCWCPPSMCASQLLCFTFKLTSIALARNLCSPQKRPELSGLKIDKWSHGKYLNMHFSTIDHWLKLNICMDGGGGVAQRCKR